MKILKKRQIAALAITTLLIFTTSAISFINYNQRKINSNTARSLRYTLSLYNRLLSSLITSQSGARGYAFTKKQEILEDYFPAIEESLRIASILKRYPLSSEARIIGLKSGQETDKLDDIVRSTNKQQNKLAFQQIIEDNESWSSLSSLLKRQIAATENKITVIADANRRKLVIEFWAQATLIILLCFLLFLCIRIYLTQEKTKIQLESSFYYYKTETDTVNQRTYEMVAHEMRVPLQIILNYLGLLRLSSLSVARIEEAYTNIDNAVDRIINIIDTMLFLSSDAKPVFQIEDITVICKTAIEQMKGLTPDAFIVESIPSYPVALSVNESVFTSFLYNLISNAVKYSPTGKPVKVEVDQDQDNVIITISDCGIGIPEEELENLFKPFFRASNVGKTKGNGIGLTVARKSVEMHGGTLHLYSVLGTGTTFVASFPKPA